MKRGGEKRPDLRTFEISSICETKIKGTTREHCPLADKAVPIGAWVNNSILELNSEVMDANGGNQISHC